MDAKKPENQPKTEIPAEMEHSCGCDECGHECTDCKDECESECKGDCQCESECKTESKCDTTKIITDLVEKYKRLQAEFANYIKRIEKEQTTVCKMAKKDVILKFINVVEDIDRTVESAKSSSKEDMEKALNMVCKECHKILDSEQVKEIDCKGAPDVYKHEVIMHVDGHENKIMNVIQKGYTMQDIVIRYAKVAVGGKKNG